jgi:hypothetical protein
MRYYDYIVADVHLRCSHDLVELGLNGFKPFAVESNNTSPAVTINIYATPPPSIEGKAIASSYLREADSNGSFMRTKNGYAYIVSRHDHKSANALFQIDCANNQAECYISINDNTDIAILRFGLWVIYSITIAPLRGIAIHSSAIAYEGRSALFLGESGTGKSTHTRLWRENIEGAHLLNDDSPILRVVDGTPYAYGSPWSGKTPCYKNKRLPLAGLVRLSQAPHNKIKRVNTLLAIGALLPSCPHILATDDALQDEICTTLSQVIATTPIYRLECLPDAEAAALSCKTLFAR